MKRYDVWIEPAVHQARKHLPGHFRQRVKRLIVALADDPRPPNSRALDVSELDVPSDVEPRRIRMDPLAGGVRGERRRSLGLGAGGAQAATV